MKSSSTSHPPSADQSSTTSLLRSNKRPPPAILPAGSGTFQEPLQNPISSPAPYGTALSPTTTTSPTMPAPVSSRSHSFPFTVGNTPSMFRSRSKSPPQHLSSIAQTPQMPPRETTSTSHRTDTECAISTTSPTRPGYIRKAKRNSQGSGVMQCGRHSNDWLFGGVSIRETVKGIWKDSEDH